MISNITKNQMGTVSFNGLFKPQRKLQDFIVYPVGDGDDARRVIVQSDKRIGCIDLVTGVVSLSPNQRVMSYLCHLPLAVPCATLSGENLLTLKLGIFATAHGHAGSNGIIYSDNSGAIEVMGAL